MNSGSASPSWARPPAALLPTDSAGGGARTGRAADGSAARRGAGALWPGRGRGRGLRLKHAAAARWRRRCPASSAAHRRRARRRCSASAESSRAISPALRKRSCGAKRQGAREPRVERGIERHADLLGALADRVERLIELRPVRVGIEARAAQRAKRSRAREREEGDHAEREQVHAGRAGRGGVHRVGRRVAGRAAPAQGLGRAAPHGADAEVGDAHPLRIVRRNEHVLRLQIAMQQPRGVRGVERARQHRQRAAQLGDAQRAVRRARGDRATAQPMRSAVLNGTPALASMPKS